MWLPEAQLYHYKARAYAPSLGRFLQSDPILYAGGMNLYAYVGNDPVNWRDPSGLQQAPNPDGGGTDSELPDIIIPGYRPLPWTQTAAGTYANHIIARGAQIGAALAAMQAAPAAPTDCPECEDIVITAVSCSDLGTLGEIGRCEIARDDALFHADPFAGLRLFGQFCEVTWCAGVGGAVGRTAWLGREIQIGRNLRLAPFGNRTPNPLSWTPHYHRRGPIDPLTGETRAGQGIGRHRPWETKEVNPPETFWDRF